VSLLGRVSYQRQSSSAFFVSFSCRHLFYLRDNPYSSSSRNTQRVSHMHSRPFNLPHGPVLCLLHRTGRRNPSRSDGNPVRLPIQYMQVLYSSRGRSCFCFFYVSLSFRFSSLCFIPTTSYSYTWLIKKLPPLTRHSFMNLLSSHGVCME